MGSLVRETGASILICRGFSRPRDTSGSVRVCNAVEGEGSLVAAADVDVETQAEEFSTVEEIKAALYTSLEGTHHVPPKIKPDFLLAVAGCQRVVSFNHAFPHFEMNVYETSAKFAVRRTDLKKP